jgi:[acyl-carrier-protein] S-malonyltransferase
MEATSIAWLFPGQGSQYVGMGFDLHRAYPECEWLFRQADDVLGFPLSELIFRGSPKELQETQNAQPAILTVSLAHLVALKLLGLVPDADFMAGHSLGEFTALVAAGSISFPEAVALVRFRGELMHQAAGGNTGMAAIIGLDDDLLPQLTARSGVEVANYNCPGQVAVSGTKEAIARAMAVAKELGARKVVELPVGAAFHSSFMRDVAEKFAERVTQLHIVDAVVPIVANSTAQPIQKADEIRRELVQQAYMPVLWTQSVSFLAEQGVRRFIEIGPGKVLSGLVKRIVRDAEVLNSESVLAGESHD